MRASLNEQDAAQELERKILQYIEGWMTWRCDREEWIRKKLYAEDYHQGYVRLVEHYQGTVEGKRILDLGCGMGGFSAAASIKQASAISLDPSVAHLEITKLRLQKHGCQKQALLRGIGESLPFASAGFDTVCAFQVLEHVNDPERVLSELSRVLRPGGYAFVTYARRFALVEPHYLLPLLTWMPGKIADGIVKASGRDSGRQPTGALQVSKMHYFTHRGFKKLAYGTGFSICSDPLRDTAWKHSPGDKPFKKILKVVMSFLRVRDIYIAGLAMRRPTLLCILTK